MRLARLTKILENPIRVRVEGTWWRRFNPFVRRRSKQMERDMNRWMRENPPPPMWPDTFHYLYIKDGRLHHGLVQDQAQNPIHSQAAMERLSHLGLTPLGEGEKSEVPASTRKPGSETT